MIKFSQICNITYFDLEFTSGQGLPPYVTLSFVNSGSSKPGVVGQPFAPTFGGGQDGGCTVNFGNSPWVFTLATSAGWKGWPGSGDGGYTYLDASTIVGTPTLTGGAHPLHVDYHLSGGSVQAKEGQQVGVYYYEMNIGYDIFTTPTGGGVALMQPLTDYWKEAKSGNPSDESLGIFWGYGPAAPGYEAWQNGVRFTDPRQFTFNSTAGNPGPIPDNLTWIGVLTEIADTTTFPYYAQNLGVPWLPANAIKLPCIPCCNPHMPAPDGYDWTPTGLLIPKEPR